MSHNSPEEVKIRFKKAFANLPEKVRNEDVILVVDKKPYTWNATFFEIENNTPLGKKMLKKLEELGLI